MYFHIVKAMEEDFFLKLLGMYFGKGVKLLDPAVMCKLQSLGITVMQIIIKRSKNDPILYISLYFKFYFSLRLSYLPCAKKN